MCLHSVHCKGQGRRVELDSLAPFMGHILHWAPTNRSLCTPTYPRRSQGCSEVEIENLALFKGHSLKMQTAHQCAPSSLPNRSQGCSEVEMQSLALFMRHTLAMLKI